MRLYIIELNTIPVGLPSVQIYSSLLRRISTPKRL
jgi:hypothetical protein